MLEAIEQVGKDKYRNALWRCKCLCGNEIVIPGTLVSRKKQKSCGCIVGNAGARTLTAEEAEMTVRQWADLIGCSPQAIYDRIQLGWTDKEVIASLRRNTRIKGRK